jgi:hypothetical protein
MKFAPTLVSSAVLIGTASAASIVQTKSYAFLPDGSQNLSFNKFDTTLGTLTSVTVAVNLNKTGGRFEVDINSRSI